MFSGFAKTAVVVGLGAAAAKWADIDPTTRTIMLASLGTAGVILSVATRARMLKSQGRAVFITGEIGKQVC